MARSLRLSYKPPIWKPILILSPQGTWRGGWKAAVVGGGVVEGLVGSRTGAAKAGAEADSAMTGARRPCLARSAFKSSLCYQSNGGHESHFTAAALTASLVK